MASVGRGVERDARPWHWERNVVGGQQADGLPGTMTLEGAGGFFATSPIPLESPTLWLFDCRTGGGENRCGAWTTMDYREVVQRMRSWMPGITRWRAVFLLGRDLTAGDVIPLPALPEGTISQRGVYVFDGNTTDQVWFDGKVEGHFEVLADVVIVTSIPIEEMIPSGEIGDAYFPSTALVRECMFKEPKVIWERPLHDPNCLNPHTIFDMLKACWPEGWLLVLSGLSGTVPTLCSVIVGRRVVVLEAGPLKEDMLVQWTNSNLAVSTPYTEPIGTSAPHTTKGK